MKFNFNILIKQKKESPPAPRGTGGLFCTLKGAKLLYTRRDSVN